MTAKETALTETALAATPPTEQQVRELDRRRVAALLAGDVTELRGLISPECTYVHAVGMSESGRSYVDNFERGRFRYDELSVVVESVALFGGVAVVICEQTSRIRFGGEPHDSVGRCTAVWARTPEGDRLVAFQTTLLAEFDSPDTAGDPGEI
jgi:ketosteroid isomerase-like protein